MNSISSMNNLLFRVVAFSLLFLAVSVNAEEIDKVQELQRPEPPIDTFYLLDSIFNHNTTRRNEHETRKVHQGSNRK